MITDNTTGAGMVGVGSGSTTGEWFTGGVVGITPGSEQEIRPQPQVCPTCGRCPTCGHRVAPQAPPPLTPFWNQAVPEHTTIPPAWWTRPWWEPPFQYVVHPHPEPPFIVTC